MAPVLLDWLSITLVAMRHPTTASQCNCFFAKRGLDISRWLHNCLWLFTVYLRQGWSANFRWLRIGMRGSTAVTGYIYILCGTVWIVHFGTSIIPVPVLMSTLTQLHPAMWSSVKMFACLSGSSSRSRGNDKPWFSRAVKAKLAAKNEAYRTDNVTKYRQAKSRVRREIRRVKTRYIEPRSRSSALLITLVRFGGACSGSLGSNQGLSLVQTEGCCSIWSQPRSAWSVE